MKESKNQWIGEGSLNNLEKVLKELHIEIEDSNQTIKETKRAIIEIQKEIFKIKHKSTIKNFLRKFVFNK
jgi:hypothetical protein